MRFDRVFISNHAEGPQVIFDSCLATLDEAARSRRSADSGLPASIYHTTPSAPCWQLTGCLERAQWENILWELKVKFTHWHSSKMMFITSSLNQFSRCLSPCITHVVKSKSLLFSNVSSKWYKHVMAQCGKTWLEQGVMVQKWQTFTLQLYQLIFSS